jgi:hypothetical protein
MATTLREVDILFNDGTSQSSSASFAPGTKMLFQQTAAPTGWTKDTTHNNKALRVVSGTASSGGSVAFTTAFASQGVGGTVGNTTLTTAQIPAHSHSGGTGGGGSHNHAVFHIQAGTATNSGVHAGGGSRGETNGQNAFTTTVGNHTHTFTTNNTGDGGAHNHSFTGTAINLEVSYVDLIIATKN